MFLSLFFSVTSALVSTLIQQWAREYLQYSQPIAAPHKRGRVRAYLFQGLSQFQMRRLTYGVPVLLHLAVFLFFFALSEFLYSINGPVGRTARYCLVVLLAVYIALSILPLVARNSPYQTALTTPLQACVKLIQFSYFALLQIIQGSADEAQRGSALFDYIHVDRARVLISEIKKKGSILDRFAMHWLLQELDEDNMDTFLKGLPDYIHSPLTDPKVLVEGLRKDGIPRRIREHFKTCVTPLELSEEASMSRASACIKSLRQIFETEAGTTVIQLDSENNDIQAIMDYLESRCSASNPSTALRASCIRALAIQEFLVPLGHPDIEQLLTQKFPDYLMPLSRVIHMWKTTDIDQWSQFAAHPPTAPQPLLNDQEKWSDLLCDGPLINLAVLSYAVRLRASEGEVNLAIAWNTLETLLKALGLAQAQASALTHARFNEVLSRVRGGISRYEGGARAIPLLETLNTIVRGLHLAEVLVHLPKPRISPRTEALYGREQLGNSELLEAFAAGLPGFIDASPPEVSKSFMERLIQEDKLWEQLNISLSKCLRKEVPFPDKLRVFMAFFDVFDVVFMALKDSSVVNWHSHQLTLLIGHLLEFQNTVARGKLIESVFSLRHDVACAQFYHAHMAQFSMQRSRGEPIISRTFNILEGLVGFLGLGDVEDREYFVARGLPQAGPQMSIKAEGILSVILRDGPLSNFYMLGRVTFEMTITEASDLTSEDVKKPWTLLRRMLDTPHLPLDNASVTTWAKFDHFRDEVRGVVTSENGASNAEKLRPLLEMIEEVNRMRPTVDTSTERIMPSRGQRHDGPHPETQSGYFMNLGPFPPSALGVDQLGATHTASMHRFGPNTWDSHIYMDPRIRGASGWPISSNPTTPPGPSAISPYPQFPHVPRARPPGLEAHTQSMISPPHAGPMDHVNLAAFAGNQPIPMNQPFPPSHLLGHSYPDPASSPGSPDMAPLGSVNQGSLVSEGGCPTP